MMMADELVAVQDAASCKLWLSHMVPNDSGRALQQFDGLLQRLQRQPLPALATLEVLERLRPAAFAAVRATIKDLEFQPLPLEPVELAAFMAVRRVLEYLRDAYIDLVSGLGDRLAPTDLDRLSPSSGVLLGRHLALARAIDCHGFLLGLYFRARLQIDARQWDLHGRLADAAQGLDALDDRIPDLLQAEKFDTCRAAVIYPWLMHLTWPYGATEITLRLARVCARAWAKKVSFQIDPVNMPGVPLAGPVFSVGQRYRIRLDTSRLIPSVQKRIEALAAGKSVEALGFPLRIDAAACLEGLKALAVCWGSSADSTAAWRESPETQYVRVTCGFAPLAPAVDAPPPEASWRFLRESSQGLTFSRQARRPRLHLDSLVSLRFADDAPLFLGKVTALRQLLLDDEAGGDEGACEIGLRLFGETDQATLILADHAPVSVFRVRANTSLAAPPLLAIPVRCFRAGMPFELRFDETTIAGRFEALKARSADYDLISFSSA